MKIYKLNLTAILFIILIFCQTNKAEKLNYQSNIDDNNLSGKKWFLVELLQTKNDSTVNLVGVMHPCEKDNFTEFLSDGKYIIYEGETKCKATDREIKNEGDWELDVANNIFYETPSGGKEFEKKVLSATSSEFIIEFTGLNNVVYTVKYLAEENYSDYINEFKEVVKKDSSLLTSVQLPHRETITNLVKKVVQTSNRFCLVNENESDHKTDKLKFQKTVAVFPFTDEAISEDDRNQQIATLKNNNVDYAIIGTIVNTDFNKETEKSTATYTIDLWDNNAQKFINKEITGTHRTDKILKTFGQVIGAIGVLAFGIRYGIYNPDLADLIPNKPVNNKRDTTQINQYFSELEADRNELLGLQGKLTKQAIEKSKNSLKNFLYEAIPIHFEIAEVLKTKKDGAPKSILISGGAMADLKMLQNLQVVQVMATHSQAVNPQEIFANLLVTSIEGDDQAKCRVVKQFKNFSELMNEPDVKIVAQTK